MMVMFMFMLVMTTVHARRKSELGIRNSDEGTHAVMIEGEKDDDAGAAADDENHDDDVVVDGDDVWDTLHSCHLKPCS